MAVAAWAGRALLLSLVVLCLVGPPGSIADQPLDALAYVLGAAFLGFLLATFRRTSRVGFVVGVASLWALFTGFAVVAFLDPLAVVVDSQRDRRGPELESRQGAYLFGAFILAIGNLPVALWLWSLRAPGREARRRRALVVPDETAEQRAERARLAAEHAERQDRRQASRRRRKRRARRG